MWHGKRAMLRRSRARLPAKDLPPMDTKFPAAALDALRGQLQGRAVVADDADYHLARQGFVVNYQAFPQIVVYCDVFSDVAAALAFARRWELSPVCRSGGHNAAGYAVNNEIVIDLSGLTYVVVEPELRRATVGAGTTFARLNATLDGFGLHLPSGGCDDVAIAGYAMGGGFGFTSQIFGMHCDSMVEALVMLADGSIVVASAARNADLFWALRGGTGNNFGVLLQATYRLHALGELWGFGIRWALGRAGEHADAVGAALVALQNGYAGAAVPPGLGHQSTINFIGEDPYLLLRGVYAGSPEQGRTIVAPLLATGGAALDIDRSGGYLELNDYLNSTPDVPQIVTHTRTQADSRYIERPLSAGEWASVLRYFVRSPNLGNFIGIEGYGGAIAALAPTATAFWHRKALFDVYIWVFWLNAEEEAASLAFLQEFRRVMAPCSNGHAYQNYPNRSSHDYRWMYWGENFPGLLSVKGKYDPTNLFRFGQTVSPVPSEAGQPLTVPTGAAGPALDSPIDVLVPAPSAAT